MLDGILTQAKLSIYIFLIPPNNLHPTSSFSIPATNLTCLQIHSTSTLYHFSCDLILTSCLSILELGHSHLNFSSSNWLSSEVVTSSNSFKATHVDCKLFLSIYIIQIFKILLPNPSHLILSLCLPPISILLSH